MRRWHDAILVVAPIWIVNTPDHCGEMRSLSRLCREPAYCSSSTSALAVTPGTRNALTNAEVTRTGN